VRCVDVKARRSAYLFDRQLLRFQGMGWRWRSHD
jgi:hypothetical protein